MKLARLSIVLGFWFLAPGCAQCNIIEPLVVQVVDSVDQSVAEVTHELQAEFAWLRWNDLFPGQPFRHDFASGFRSAYVDVLDGASGEAPLLPPRCYWRRCYENAAGRQKAYTWFEGYHYGAIAAQQDGAGIWNALPLNLPPEDGAALDPLAVPVDAVEVIDVLPPGEPLPVIIEEHLLEPGHEAGPTFAPETQPAEEHPPADEPGPVPAQPGPAAPEEEHAPADEPGPAPGAPAPAVPESEMPAPGRIPFPPLEPSPENP